MKCDERINHQESTSRSEQLRDSSQPGGIKYGQSHRSFDEIEHQRGKSAAAAEQQSDQQDADILHGQRNGGERHERNRDVRTERHKQACAHDQRNLPRGLERALRGGSRVESPILP